MLCNKCLFIIIKLSIIGFIFVAIVQNNPYATLLKQPPLSIGQVIGVVFMFFYIGSYVKNPDIKVRTNLSKNSD